MSSSPAFAVVAIGGDNPASKSETGTTAHTEDVVDVPISHTGYAVGSEKTVFVSDDGREAITDSYVVISESGTTEVPCSCSTFEELREPIRP